MEKDELLERAKKEASFKAQMEQFRINYDQPTLVPMGDIEVKIYPITGYVADKMSMYLIQQEALDTHDVTEALAKQRPNIKLQCKAIALALLNDPRGKWKLTKGWRGDLKITFLHWFVWRRLFHGFNSAEYGDVLAHIIEKLGLVFFFQNMGLAKSMNTMKRKKTKEEVELLQADVESEK